MPGPLHQTTTQNKRNDNELERFDATCSNDNSHDTICVSSEGYYQMQVDSVESRLYLGRDDSHSILYLSIDDSSIPLIEFDIIIHTGALSVSDNGTYLFYKGHLVRLNITKEYSMSSRIRVVHDGEDLLKLDIASPCFDQPIRAYLRNVHGAITKSFISVDTDTILAIETRDSACCTITLFPTSLDEGWKHVCMAGVTAVDMSPLPDMDLSTCYTSSYFNLSQSALEPLTKPMRGNPISVSYAFNCVIRCTMMGSTYEYYVLASAEGISKIPRRSTILLALNVDLLIHDLDMQFSDVPNNFIPDTSSSCMIPCNQPIEHNDNSSPTEGSESKSDNTSLQAMETIDVPVSTPDASSSSAPQVSPTHHVMSRNQSDAELREFIQKKVDYQVSYSRAQNQQHLQLVKSVLDRSNCELAKQVNETTRQFASSINAAANSQKMEVKSILDRCNTMCAQNEKLCGEVTILKNELADCKQMLTEVCRFIKEINHRNEELSLKLSRSSSQPRASTQAVNGSESAGIPNAASSENGCNYGSNSNLMDTFDDGNAAGASKNMKPNFFSRLFSLRSVTNDTLPESKECNPHMPSDNQSHGQAPNERRESDSAIQAQLQPQHIGDDGTAGHQVSTANAEYTWGNSTLPTTTKSNDLLMITDRNGIYRLLTLAKKIEYSQTATTNQYDMVFSELKVFYDSNDRNSLLYNMSRYDRMVNSYGTFTALAVREIPPDALSPNAYFYIMLVANLIESFKFTAQESPEPKYLTVFHPEAGCAVNVSVSAFLLHPTLRSERSDWIRKALQLASNVLIGDSNRGISLSKTRTFRELKTQLIADIDQIVQVNGKNYLRMKQIKDSVLSIYALCDSHSSG